MPRHATCRPGAADRTGPAAAAAAAEHAATCVVCEYFYFIYFIVRESESKTHTKQTRTTQVPSSHATHPLKVRARLLMLPEARNANRRCLSIGFFFFANKFK
jgi:hypothetical protein